MSRFKNLHSKSIYNTLLTNDIFAIIITANLIPIEVFLYATSATYDNAGR
jgi:hypothetical protein